MGNRTRNAVTTVAVIVLALLALSLMWGRAMMGRGMMDWGIATMPWWRGLLPFYFFWISAITAIGLAIAWAVQQVSRAQDSQRSEPLEILKQRYARGEITREQYEQIRHDLGSPA